MERLCGILIFTLTSFCLETNIPFCTNPLDLNLRHPLEVPVSKFSPLFQGQDNFFLAFTYFFCSFSGPLILHNFWLAINAF